MVVKMVSELTGTIFMSVFSVAIMQSTQITETSIPPDTIVTIASTPGSPSDSIGVDKFRQ